jgi:D-alanyl-D-alanine carboxypeptidase/D-alanyl-D-alanine-endopeptidase (penicillin-binding protein 4)
VTAKPVLPGATGLRAALAKQFALAGPSSGAAVYDVTDGASLFTLRDGIARPPASVEKLYTSVALLRAFGPQATFETQVEGVGSLGARGVRHGDL